jgi:uncharacterized protein YacL
LNNQIASTSRILTSLRIACEGERRKIENLYNEKTKLESIVTEFKGNNEEYLKIKQVAEENVKSVLTNHKLLLRFTTASVIESLGRNPELCNFVFNDISNNYYSSYGSNYSLSLMLSGQQQQQSVGYLNDDIFTAVILEEAEKLYNKLTTKLTNEIIAASVSIRASLLPSDSSQPEIYNNDQQRPNG